MAGEWIATIGMEEDYDRLFTGKFLKGRGEPRVAFVGRSNVGKSSLINALMGGRLAKVSNEPGKTKCIYFYYWKDVKKIIADLPGYGYAKTAKVERERWAGFIQTYLRRDEALERALVLLDSRHGPTDLDLEAIRFLSSESVPVTFIFTKSDVLKNQKEKAARIKEASQALLDAGYDPRDAIWLSSKSREGIHTLEKELAKKG